MPLWVEDIFNLSLISSALRTTTPILIVALGGSFAWKVGIMNVGLEGIMLLSAFFAVLGSIFSGSSLAGLGLAIAVGVLTALLMALFIVKFQANPIVVGLAINIFASGFTIAAMQQIFGNRGSIIDARIVGFPRLWMNWLDRIPIVGEIFNGFTPFVYISFVLVVAVSYFLYWTRPGLYIRVVGEHERAANSIGIDVNKVKFLALGLSGLFGAIAGAHLSIGYINMFTENMSSGRGFMALAAIIFSDGSPLGLALASLLFGFSDALSMRLQGFGVSSYLVLMVPYLITLLFLFVISLPKMSSQKKQVLQKIKGEIAG